MTFLKKKFDEECLKNLDINQHKQTFSTGMIVYGPW